jgi:hypothetical protein
MIDRLPRRLRVAFGAPEARPGSADSGPDGGGTVVDFVAYSVDCILSGRTVIDGDRLSDMLNDHDEYALLGVTVERFDGGPPMVVDELVVSRDEIWVVHTGAPRGVEARRHRTSQQYVALKMSPYRVRGFFHGLPGTNPITSIGRRKAMIPLTNVRIEYTIDDDVRETRVDVAIVNRDQVEWLDSIEPDRAEFPPKPTPRTPDEDVETTKDATAVTAADAPSAAGPEVTPDRT